MAGGQGRALGSGSIPDAPLCEKKYNQLNSGNALMVSERVPFLLSTSFMKSRKVDFYIFPFIDFGCMIEEKGRELLWEILKLKRVL